MKKLATLLVCICILFAVKSTAQSFSDSVKRALQQVSDEMYAADDKECFIVQAITDELIQPGQKFVFIYDTGVITINGNKPAGGLRERYLIRAGHFLQMGKGCIDSCNMGIDEGGITLAEIFDANSKFRKRLENSRIAMNREILRDMSSSKLIDTADYKILYNIHGLYVNNEKVPADIAGIYIAMIESEGFYPIEESDEFVMEHPYKGD